MPPACQVQFAALAAADGIVLSDARKVPWLNQRGHLGAPNNVDTEAISRIYAELGGDETLLAAKRMTPIAGDLEHAATGTFIEIDELQHFTSHRALTLSLYPTYASIAFDRLQYLGLCEQWSGKADRAFAHKPAVGFGPRGRPRQRAYNDSLRDLLPPSMGRPPVIRIAVPDRDVVGAYAGVRDLLHAM